MSGRANTQAPDRRALLSAIWIFAVLNYLYCDVLSLMDAPMLKGYLAGTLGGLQFTQEFLLGAGILMEISIAMVLLSRVLPYKTNRRANIVAGVITTAVQVVSLTLGTTPTAYYWFFSVIEIAATASVVWIAWTWRHPFAQKESAQVNPLRSGTAGN